LRGGRNLYAYVGNDPTNFIDPFGLCSESASVTTRVIDGIEGTANLSLATLKTVGLGAADTALGALGPESGGLSIVAAAALTTYGVTSIGGQAVSGAGQLYTAFTGNSSTGENLTQAGDILAGPASGISTLASTGNAAQAQQNANVESMITAGTGLVNSKTVSGAIQSVVDTALSVVSVVQNFANSYVNNFQAAFLPSARWW
jgi:hypothetical protein